MAKLFAFLSLVFLALFLLTGCDAAEPVAMVDMLPAPNFGGPPNPELAQVPTPVPPAVPASVLSHHATHIDPTASAGVPRTWIPIAAPNEWYWIVIHHSATATGGAAAFDKMHRAKGWDELGYHFVIGNGTDTADGLVEVGSRWPKQKWGAHAKTPDNRYNEHGIGICLVGNFDITHPTAKQMASLDKLVSYLMKTYHISPDHILGHRDTKRTDCPGANMDVALVRAACVRMLADAGDEVPQDSRTATGELMMDAPAVKPE
jgi:hypothetical protein